MENTNYVYSRRPEYEVSLSGEEVRAIFKANSLLRQHPSSPNHFLTWPDQNWMFFVHDSIYSKYVRIIIMDWSLKSRPTISVEDFLNRASPEAAKVVLWNLELFSKKIGG